ncbi:MAG: hypothetical protein KDA41_00540 [Planctomycetales bacterium]|nr:hypothetical protein [Planctomycetales bacterium]
MSRWIDIALAWLKWPAGVAAVVALPWALRASWLLGLRVVEEPATLRAFVLGFVGYAALWRLVLRRRLLGTFFSTLEHELTHALFAWATLHRVVELRSTFRQGGHVRFRGAGNWLITLAPYFFPTLSVAIIAVGWLLPNGWLTAADAALGAATAYHIVSTFHETHLGQSDLRKAGLLFSLCWLPTANVLAYAAIVAFCHAGPAGLTHLLADLLP